MDHIVEAYTAGGVVNGTVTQQGGLRDGLDDASALVLERAVWYPIDGGPAQRRGKTALAPDDIVAVATDETETPIHAVWHPIVLEAGPYRISGDLPTVPGFDPGRALTRPGGAFLALRGVRIELLGRPGLGMVERATALVNRYMVERVSADLILGFFFPGATLETLEGRPA